MIKESWQDPDAGYDFTEEEIEKIKWLDRLRENRIEIEKIIERIEWHANAATSRKTALAEVFIKKRS